MKATILKGPREVRLEDMPMPTVGSGEILVRMAACGVCGTDVEKMQGDAITPPMLGHEVVGDVVKIGDEVQDLTVGDRVFVHHHVPCYTCHYCRRGDYTMCEEFSGTTIQPCGFAEYFSVPEKNVKRGAVIKLPENMGYEEATFIEPLGCCLKAANKLGIKPSDVVAVFGVGTTGLLHLQLARLFGASRIIAGDVIDFRLELAKKLGADSTVNLSHMSAAEDVLGFTSNRGPDSIVVSTNNMKALTQALDMVRKGGQVLLFGAPPKGTLLTYDVSKLFIREITLVTSYSTSERETHMALELLKNRRISVSPIITHRFPLNKINEALNLAAKGGECIKIMVSPIS